MADVKDVKCVYWDTPVEPGDVCRVAVEFQYQGPATTKKIYAAIGNVWGFIFDEVLSAEKDLSIPASYPAGSWNSYTTYVHIPITAALDPAGSPYALFGKVRIAWIGWEESPYYQDKIVVGGAPPEEIIDFSISRPIAYPVSAPAGPVLITCPVTSRSTTSQTARVKCLVYEGSILPGHGTKLWEEAKTVTFAPGETKDVEFMRTSVATGAERRDVEVEVTVSGQMIVQKEWDDVYYVTAPPEEIIDFSLSRPTADPDSAQAGPVKITCPMISRSTINVTAQVKCLVYEGSILPGHGTKLWEGTKTVTFAPGEIKDVEFMLTSVATDAERRDVEVEVYAAGQLIVQKEWDDVYYVTIEELPGEVDFSGVITEVKPLTFEFGELVKLLVSFTAFARNWPAQILWETRVTATLDGLSGSITQFNIGEDGSRDELPVHLGAMPNQNLTGEVVLEARVGWPYPWQELYRLPINVTVSGAGCIIDADCPPGYICQGGICVPEDAGPPITCSIDADCPPGYTCQAGVCVKTGETPWAWIAAGALALMLLLPGKRAKKGK